MIQSLHNHTARCHHATGTEEEYVLAAIAGGLESFGFSDHAPQHYPGDYVSRVRMLPQQLPEYARCIRQLQEQYGDQLKLHLGLEAEFYPSLFPALLQQAKDEGIEYLILGQHWIENEIGTDYVAKATADVSRLEQYCNQTIDAMQTGVFTYLAHPDVFHFLGDEKVYETHMRRLCREAKACQMAMEINLWGLREGKHYPTQRFWALAAEENCPVILGGDAHRPDAVADPELEAKAMQIVRTYGLQLLPSVSLQKL